MTVAQNFPSHLSCSNRSNRSSAVSFPNDWNVWIN
jgi:hypothetical protein